MDQDLELVTRWYSIKRLGAYISLGSSETKRVPDWYQKTRLKPNHPTLANNSSVRNFIGTGHEGSTVVIGSC